MCGTGWREYLLKFAIKVLYSHRPASQTPSLMLIHFLPKIYNLYTSHFGTTNIVWKQHKMSPRSINKCLIPLKINWLVWNDAWWSSCSLHGGILFQLLGEQQHPGGSHCVILSSLRINMAMRLNITIVRPQFLDSYIIVLYEWSLDVKSVITLLPTSWKQTY